MHQLIEGVYHDGHIDVNQPISLENNTKLKLWIISDNETKPTKVFGSYKFKKSLDKVNIREFIYEDK